MQNTLNTLFAKSVSQFALHIAIEDLSGNKMTYAQLHTKSVKLSDLLNSKKIGAGCRIGILSSKNTDYVACVFSILNLNAAYVPMDINAPEVRIKTMMDDCDMQGLFVETSMIRNYSFLSENTRHYTTEKISDVMSLVVFTKVSVLHKELLAYILYTSGSTGIPKGVMHTHESALAFINWSIKKFKPTTSDTFVSHAPFHFDLSIFDLYVSIGIGATLVLIDDKTASNPLELAHQLTLHRINYLYATPSTLVYLSNFGKLHKHSYETLRVVLFAGEVFPVEQLKLLKAQLPHTVFYNLYGPTETNVCTYYKVPKRIANTQLQPYPIGKPCTFADTYINEEGELWVSGKSLMTGYWNDCSKTEQAMCKDEKGVVWYKTGDLVSVTSDNNLVYTGRKDRMIKRNGFRIELGEIESVVSKNVTILQIAATSSSLNGQTDNLITIHVTPATGRVVTELELYQYCRKNLPPYMIPDRIQFYDKLPVTSTNKIDYKKLSLVHD